MGLVGRATILGGKEEHVDADSLEGVSPIDGSGNIGVSCPQLLFESKGF